MDRLTKRAKDGLAYSDIPLNQSSVLDVNENIVECYTGFIAERLAAYEDTGLEPEEITQVIKSGVPEWIDKYLEYRKLEEQGLLIKLPCKVGDTVYEKTENCPECEDECDWDEWDNQNCCHKSYVKETEFHEYLRHYIGKTVFLTREEAEKILKESEEK